MKAYLDTNILRQLNKIPETIKVGLVCSQLGIMELIAGMTSEKEYSIRKSALNNILKRNIYIIWESIRTLQTKAFALNIPDYDVPATKALMEEIIRTTTLAEAKNIQIEFGGNDYSISTLTEHDKILMNESVSIFSKTISLCEDRQRLQKFPYTPAEVCVQSEIMIINFLNALGIKKFASGQENSLDRDFTPEYLNAIGHYYKSPILNNYLYCLTSYTLDAIKNGSQPGRNDGHDIAHLAYSDGIDFFISDDKIYQRLSHELFTIKFLKLNEFIFQH